MKNINKKLYVLIFLAATLLFVITFTFSGCITTEDDEDSTITEAPTNTVTETVTGSSEEKPTEIPVDTPTEDPSEDSRVIASRLQEVADDYLSVSYPNENITAEYSENYGVDYIREYTYFAFSLYNADEDLHMCYLLISEEFQAMYTYNEEEGYAPVSGYINTISPNAAKRYSVPEILRSDIFDWNGGLVSHEEYAEAILETWNKHELGFDSVTPDAFIKALDNYMNENEIEDQLIFVIACNCYFIDYGSYDIEAY